MKSNITLTFIALALILGLSSCYQQKQILNTSLINEYNLDEQDLKAIQFYLSGTVVLYKSNTKGTTKKSQNGELEVSEVTKSNRLVIEDGTLGVVIKRIDDKRLAVSFESDDSKVLIFGDVDNSGTYILLAEKWTDGMGKISYGDGTYYIQPSYGVEPHLVFNFIKSKNSQTETRVVGGRGL